MMRKIFKQQLSLDPVLPKVSFSRLVREVMATHSEEVVNLRGDGIRALQCAAEEHLTELFSNAARLAHYCNRDTVTAADLRFVVHDASEYAAMHMPDREESSPGGLSTENGVVPEFPLSEQALPT